MSDRISETMWFLLALAMVIAPWWSGRDIDWGSVAAALALSHVYEIKARLRAMGGA